MMIIIAYPEITITKSITFHPSLKYVFRSNTNPMATIFVRASAKKIKVITKFSISMLLFLLVNDSLS
jgi:hypothetical protein